MERVRSERGETIDLLCCESESNFSGSSSSEMAAAGEGEEPVGHIISFSPEDELTALVQEYDALVDWCVGEANNKESGSMPTSAGAAAGEGGGSSRNRRWSSRPPVPIPRSPAF